jgi:hypothetical protein
MHHYLSACIASFATLFFTACHGAEQRASKSEASAALVLAKNLYSKGLSKFEMPAGNSEVLDTCEYIRSIFSANLIKSNKSNCDVKGNLFVRFPTLASEDLEGITPNAPAFSHTIREGEKMGGITAIHVITPTNGEFQKGKVVYFIEATSTGAKIVNFLSYTSYPLDLTGDYKDCVTRSAYFKFALPPKTELEIADLPATCRALTRTQFGIGTSNR